MMDNLIDNMDFPDERFKVNVTKYRPIGVGFMGLADTLLELNIPYDSKEGVGFASKCMEIITTACIEMSADRALTHGRFTDYETVESDTIEIISKLISDEKVIEKVKNNGLRNIQHTTIAPTGSIALSCDSSYGMEPIFGLAFIKTLVESGDSYTLVNPIFKKKFENESWYTVDLMDKIVKNNGSLKGLRGIPQEVRDVFVVAHDIKPKDRIDMQAGLQKSCSTGISSTINLPNSATKEEVAELFKYAFSKGLKGVTIYRDGCKASQPITFTKEKKEEKHEYVRPNKLQGDVYTIDTGNGKLYVTVSTYNGKPVEIFLSMGKSGQLLNSLMESLGRTISIALQNNVPIEAIQKTLDGITSDRSAFFRFELNDQKPTQILSIPDAIAKLLNRYYINMSPLHYNSTASTASTASMGEVCPKCGRQTLLKIEGCSSCSSCGYSVCG